MRILEPLMHRLGLVKRKPPNVSLPSNVGPQGKVRSRETDVNVSLKVQRQANGVQVVSDLHCERHGYERLRRLQSEQEGRYLLLVGDIANLQDLEFEQVLRELLSTFAYVMLVPGNHEFYRSSFEETIAAGQRLEEVLGARFIFMHRRGVDLDDGHTTILGCTLHSHIPPEAIKLTNDFARIHNWTRARHNEEHANDCQWLQGALADLQQEPSPRRAFVATHYPPTFEGTSHPQVDPDYRFCFASDTLAKARSWPGFELVQWWVSGHTHYNYLIIQESELRLLSNQPDDGQCKRLYDVRASI